MVKRREISRLMSNVSPWAAKTGDTAVTAVVTAIAAANKAEQHRFQIECFCFNLFSSLSKSAYKIVILYHNKIIIASHYTIFY